MLRDLAHRWSIADAAELYGIDRWGKGYFGINAKGHVTVHPTRLEHPAVDLKELVDDLKLRGLDSPILLRFNGILQDRMREIHAAFATAIADNEYAGQYKCVYPVKVNQQRQVVEEIIRCGEEFGFGLEAGSKPELLAVVAMGNPQTPIICNGFKDAEFIEMAMLAQKIGRQVIPIVEKYTELELILRVAEQVGVRPQIGMRVKLASRGAGRWQSSAGYRSKFGLTISEILRAVKRLRGTNQLDCFKLLHFHLGSQITNIRLFKKALTEAARIYADLWRQGAPLQYLDVGGGLGVDYDGTQTDFDSSVNYTLNEYAQDVVYQTRVVCDDAEVPHPTLISESGRAVAAYHSVLIFSVLGVASQGTDELGLESIDDESPQPLVDLKYALESLDTRNMLAAYHDAQEALEVANNLFCTGHLSLVERSTSENLFWAVCHRIHRLLLQCDHTPEELEGLDRLLSDTYFCNFSVFQSIPDSWAVNQLFPLMPIHRLKRAPTRDAVLGDITCDSDGKIDQFINHRDVRRTLRLHPLEDGHYYLAAFLVGAYQEILGDLHNLFGDTNAVHVNIDDTGKAILETIIKGETVNEVLDYVQINGSDLINRLQAAVDVAVRNGLLNHGAAGQLVKFYEQALAGYTYLEDHRPES